MEITKATINDLNEILKIYEHARQFMAQNGNPHQWGNCNPPADLIIQNIKEQKLYLCIEGNKIQCVFYYAHEEDPSYKIIEKGNWIGGNDYSVIHRIASAEGSKGAATYSINWALNKSRHIRIDTHADNKPMQSLLGKLGFTYCGIIHLSNGSERLAYEKMLI